MSWSYAVADRVPESVRARLKRGAAGLLPETPKPGDPAFQRVTNRLVGSNRIALAAARGAACR
jgi:glycerate-2-kinase